MGQSGQSSSLLSVIIFLVIIGFFVYRRTRPQRVRITRTILYTAAIVLVSLAGLAANLAVFGSLLFLVLAPFALLAGLLLGWLMMRTIRFRRDEGTGQVWMSGGVAYVAIWLATLVLRLGVEYAATGRLGMAGPPQPTGPLTPLAIVASDLLFLSVGLWLVRGFSLVRRYRELTPVATST
ncbi:MAG TPA: hypothetical protein VFZ25_00640 [Chloroflexota bacterium]|nr:hypothetical protein [Chloroflexota bacterium]